MIKLSRYTVETFIKCPRCAVYENKYFIRKKSIPFTLNIGVDNLAKNEFDIYRKKQEPHPMFNEYGLDAVPFDHEKIDEWRNNKQGIRYISDEHGYNFGGAIDDVWQRPNGELIISDVKATAVNQFSWAERSQEEWAGSYKRQLEMYQWLFRRNGFKVSNTSYLVYYNGLKNEPRFDQVMKFELHFEKIQCNDEWVEDAVIKTTKALNSDELPKPSSNCETCTHIMKRAKKAKELSGKSSS